MPPRRQQRRHRCSLELRIVHPNPEREALRSEIREHLDVMSGGKAAPLFERTSTQVCGPQAEGASAILGLLALTTVASNRDAALQSAPRRIDVAYGAPRLFLSYIEQFGIHLALGAEGDPACQRTGSRRTVAARHGLFSRARK